MGGSHYFFHHRLLIAANMFSADFSKRLAPMATTRKKRAFIVTRQLLEITMKKTTLNSQYQLSKKRGNSIVALKKFSCIYFNREQLYVALRCMSKLLVFRELKMFNISQICILPSLIVVSRGIKLKIVVAHFGFKSFNSATCDE